VSAFVLAALVLVAVGGFVALAYCRRWEWTGLPAARGVGEDSVVERPAKTLWDWLQLLGIPVVLAALAFLLNDAQSSRDQQREDQRAAQQSRRAADVDRENTLRTYLAQMSDLVLNERLLRSKPDAAVRNIARTATLTAVRRLDGRRRGVVVQFLGEGRLLGGEKRHTGVVNVASADLRGADLGGARLRGADLGMADLSGADLSGAFLIRADLLWADLRGANLRGADLFGANLGIADLRGAKLPGARLRGAKLFGANLGGAFLSRADLSGANLGGAGLRGADLSGANLHATDLRGANLSRAYAFGADLSGADLSRAYAFGADLSGADLSGADVSGADLRRARGVDLTSARGKPRHGP
jgi:uncharacterized protein YjbI with pentapeptide repeats